MSATLVVPKHVHYNINNIGTDYIIGDIHGCYDELMHALDKLSFDFKNDRLFSVGDLIDRGPKSMECANLIYEDWIYPVIGNHEQMMISSIIHNKLSEHRCWINNGGLWHLSEDHQLLVDLSKQFQKLPYIISVGAGIDRFNIVHAELINNTDKKNRILVTDNMIDNWEFNEEDESDMTWGRTMYVYRASSVFGMFQDAEDDTPTYQSTELSPTYVGHSISVTKPSRVEQQIYLDTGFSLSQTAKFKEQYPLIIVCPQNECYYSYTLPFNTLTKHDISSITKYK